VTEYLGSELELEDDEFAVESVHASSASSGCECNDSDAGAQPDVPPLCRRRRRRRRGRGIPRGDGRTARGERQGHGVVRGSGRPQVDGHNDVGRTPVGRDLWARPFPVSPGETPNMGTDRQSQTGRTPGKRAWPWDRVLGCTCIHRHPPALAIPHCLGLFI